MNDVVISSMLASSQYATANQAYALKLDGKQQAALGLLASQRVTMLTSQITAAIPSFSDYGISVVVMIAAFVFPLCSMSTPHAFLKLEAEQGSNILKRKACSVLLSGAAFYEQYVQYADHPVINVACCVCYVALIALGFHIQGAIGLTGLLLIAAKRNNMLPSVVDRYLDTLTWLGALGAGIYVEKRIIFRIMQIFIATMILSYQFFSHRWIRNLMPEKLQHPLAHHFVRKDVDVKRFDEMMATHSKLYKDNFDRFAQNFKVNRNYVHARCLSQLLPPDTEVPDKNTKEIFEKLFARLEKEYAAKDLKHKTEVEEKSALGKSADEEEYKKLKAGLELLELGALNGRVRDQLPSNVDEFKRLIKALAHSVLICEVDFKDKIKELGTLGHSCIEGWSRETAYLLNRNTRNIEWTVHNQLALMRSEQFQVSLCKLEGMIDSELLGKLKQQRDRKHKGEKEVEEKRALDTFGGSGGIHILNAFETAFYHRFRTYRAAVQEQLNPFGILDRLILMRMDPTKPTMSMLEIQYILLKAALVLPGAEVASPIVVSLQEDFEGYTKDCTKFRAQDLPIYVGLRDPSVLIDCIYNAIKPEYVTGPDGRREAQRQIDYKAVENWISARGAKYNLDADCSNIIATDPLGGQYLTKAGVCLLLADLGILEMK